MFLVLRQKHVGATASEQPSTAQAATAAAVIEQKATRRVVNVKFSPLLLSDVAKAADDERKREPVTLRARDGYYDHLLAMQGRDQAKEEQLISRLMEVFGDKPDTTVGEVACSAEFCRVELKGAGKVDLKKQWQADVFAAVEPKGFKFFVLSEDDAENTMASCYFGRDDSWTVPDFAKLGLM